MTTMQFLMAVLNWVQADPSHIAVLASAIAMFTPTPNPNTAAGKLYKVVDVLAMNVLHAKETGVTPDALAAQVLAILQKQQSPEVPKS